MIGVSSLYEKNCKCKEFEIVKKTSFCVLKNRDRYVMDDRKETLSLYEKNMMAFSGDVLCLGLGLGLIGFNYSKQCNSFTYVEIEQSLIELISQKQPNLVYINASAYSFVPTKKYDFIFIDIFHSLTPKAQEGAKKVVKQYEKYLKPGGKITYLKLHTN